MIIDYLDKAVKASWLDSQFFVLVGVFMAKQSRDVVPGLSAKLLAARAAAGLTLAQTAEKSGVPDANLSRFENGLKSPTLATLYRLARAYGVPVADLLPPDLHGDLPAAEEADPAPAEPPAAPVEPPKSKRK